MSWVIVAGYAPEQVVMFPTREVAAAHIFVFAPPTGFASRFSLSRAAWVLHVGEDTLDKHPRLGNLVYVDRDHFYAGSTIVREIYLEASTLLDYTQLLVQGTWKYCPTGAHEAFFYLLVPQHYYVLDQRKICPGR
jgi:hypothetical protein